MTTEGRVAGKIALVTGAAQGLGKAIAMMLAREGAKLVLTDIQRERLDEAAAEIERISPGCAHAINHDVTDAVAWTRAIAETEARWGALHILVNNAGIGHHGSIEECSLEDWHRVHRIDLDSVFLGCKYAIPLIARSGGGAIVNISSIAGIIAGHNMAAYNSAKAAVRHLSKSVALHCAKKRLNIRCNSVHPVFMATPILDDLVRQVGKDEAYAKLGRQVPLGRIGQPDDVAYAVLYLASDESSFVTGTELKVDGGISAM